MEQSNSAVAVIVLFMKEMKICPAYISKINLNHEERIIFLMIPKEEKEGWHYLAVKKISALLRRITSKHNSDSYCLKCLHSFRTETELKCHEKVCQKHYLR